LFSDVNKDILAAKDFDSLSTSFSSEKKVFKEINISLGRSRGKHVLKKFEKFNKDFTDQLKFGK